MLKCDERLWVTWNLNMNTYFFNRPVVVNKHAYIRILLANICGSVLGHYDYLRGLAPVLGHEFNIQALLEDCNHLRFFPTHIINGNNLSVEVWPLRHATEPARDLRFTKLEIIHHQPAISLSKKTELPDSYTPRVLTSSLCAWSPLVYRMRS